jgi:hypothetical protein
MELTIHVPDEFKLQAEARGLAPEAYAEQVLISEVARVSAARLQEIRTAVAEIRELRKGQRLEGLSIKELVNEDRKY